MTSLWQDADRRRLIGRLRQMRPDARPRWGSFTAGAMICHLVEAKRMVLGELVIPERNTPLRYFPLKQLIVYVLPMPRRAPTAPELLAGASAGFAEDVARLESLIERLVRASPASLAATHPAFGAMSHRAWGVLVHKHTDHHLKQFGV